MFGGAFFPAALSPLVRVNMWQNFKAVDAVAPLASNGRRRDSIIAVLATVLRRSSGT
jgi:hypothetical protein